MEPGASLAISGGMGGARLTHSHERQYHYVLQSLTLWREISHEVRAALLVPQTGLQVHAGVKVWSVRQAVFSADC